LCAAQSGDDGFSAPVTNSLRIYKSFQLLPAFIGAVKRNVEPGLRSRSSRNSSYNLKYTVKRRGRIDILVIIEESLGSITEEIVSVLARFCRRER
jgi:hypothetical protein